MTSTLRDLTGAAARSSQDLDSLQQEVEQGRVAAEKLLRDGRASGQVPSALLFKPGTSCSGRSQDASGPPGAPGLLHRDLQPDSSPSPGFLLSRWRSCWAELKLPETSPRLLLTASRAALKTWTPL